MLTEFDLIQFLNQHQKISSPYIALGIGDDAAIIDVPVGHQLLSSVDTSIQNIHFPEETAVPDIAYKSLAVSLSDMAAMGAEPVAVMLALSLPELREVWLKEFAEGFFELATQFNLPLIGGDTTRGPLSISTIVYGLVPTGKALLRSNAKVDDLVYVSGTLGDAGLALRDWRAKKLIEPKLKNALSRPSPRVGLGLALRDLASSAIDISDGLAQDLNHILKASKKGAKIQLNNLPLSKQLRSNLNLQEAKILALSAGDDYELCFTVRPQDQAKIMKIAQKQNLPLTCIGVITQDPNLKFYEGEQYLENLALSGYQHFNKELR